MRETFYCLYIVLKYCNERRAAHIPFHVDITSVWSRKRHSCYLLLIVVCFCGNFMYAFLMTLLAMSFGLSLNHVLSIY